MSTAKAQHLRRHEWSTRLARQHTVSVRSALRGIAPGKSCEEIPLEEFVAGAAAIENHFRVTVGFKYTSVLGFFFMLREIELSLMLYRSVTTDTVRKKVTILLPASKTDFEALSCSRSWGCVCHQDPDPLTCPFHAARERKALLAKTFGKSKVKQSGLPFAPTRMGTTASKEQVDKNIQMVAQARGIIWAVISTLVKFGVLADPGI